MGASCSSDSSAVVLTDHTIQTTQNGAERIATIGGAGAHNNGGQVRPDHAREKAESEKENEQSKSAEEEEEDQDAANEEEEVEDQNEATEESEREEEEVAESDEESEKQESEENSTDEDNKSDNESTAGVEEVVDVEASKATEAIVPIVPKTSSMSEADKMNAAVFGKLDIDYPNLSRIVRIFTSSTFTDTQVERNTLMEKIYPRLKAFCQEKGYDFQVVDMRWGVRDEATDDHMTSELCMRELSECQKLSTGPNFITFLGQKYGYRPFPPKLEAGLFEKILSATEAKDDKELLNFWFAKDDNSLPPYYVLQSIRSKLPAYSDDGNPDAKKKAQDTWWSSFERMQVILRQGVDKSVTDPNIRHRFYCSVTEEEIYHGLLNAPDTQQHCFWFKRVVSDLSKNTGSKNARRFMDIGSGVDHEAQSLLGELKEKKIPSKLPPENMKTYEVKWTENGIDPSSSEEHRKYIETLCSDFYRILCDMIQQGIDRKTALATASALQMECMQHAVFAQKKFAAFYGREDLLDKIKQQIANKTGNPLVLCGMPGSGKTSLLARSMELLPSWLKTDDVIIIGRFLGTSTDSSGIQKLLISLCQQLAAGCGDKCEDLHQLTLQTIQQKLIGWLEKCAGQKPVYVFLDSLDQLDDSYDGREMDWVPKKLPKNTCLVMSTVPDEVYSVLPNLKKKYSHITYIDVPLLAGSDITTILTSSLKARNRQLQAPQLNTVKSACEKCATPLFLKIAVDDALRWNSYTAPEQTTLKTTVSDVINALFDRVEKYHGHVLVTHVLAYITCAKSGLSETEIEDIMSCDDEVLNDVYQYHTPPLRRLPPLLWVRVRADLKDYLTDRGADGTQVITWYHRQFHQVATKRYLSDKAVRQNRHSHIAEYFLEKWSKGVKKPYQDKKGVKSEADRLVSPQPLVFKDDNSDLRFNLRKMNELPYHLIKAGKAGELKKNVFCNLMFLLEKFRGMEFNSVLDDFKLAEKEGLLDGELKAMKEVLVRSRNVITVDVYQLPVQLTARLISSGMKESAYIKVLLEQCQNPPFPCLTTIQGFLRGKGGSLLQKLVGHDGQVEAIGTSQDGTRVATSGMDCKVKIWDAESGKEILSIDHGEYCHHSPNAFLFCNNNQQLVATGYMQFVAWDLRGGNTLNLSDISKELRTNAVPIGWLSDHGWALVLRETLQVFTAGSWEKIHTIKDLIPPVKDPNHQARDFCGGLGKKAVLYRGCSAELLIVDLQQYVKAKSGVTKANVLGKGQKPESYLVQVDLTQTGQIACFIYEAEKYQDNVSTIKIFSIKDGSHLKTFPGFDIGFPAGSPVWSVRDNNHAVFPAFIGSDGNTTIMDVNLQTGKSEKVGHVTSVCMCLVTLSQYCTDSSADILAEIEGYEPAITRVRHPFTSNVPLDAKRMLTVSASLMDVVDVVEIGKKTATEEPEEDPDDLVEDKYSKQVDLIKPVPGSKRYMLSGYGNTALQIWDSGNMKMVRDIKIMGYTNMSIMVNTEIVVTLTHVEDVMVYDMKTPKNYGPQKKRLTSERVTTGKFTVAQGKVFLCTPKGLEILDVIADKVDKVIPIESPGLAVIKCDPTNCVLAASKVPTGDITNICMFDTKKQARLKDITFKKQGASLDSFIFSWDGKYIAAPLRDEKTTCTIWDISTGSKRSVPDHEGNNVTYLNFSKMTNSIITGMNSGFVALYDLQSLKFVRSFKPPRASMATGLTVSNTGRYLSCKGFNNSEAYVYDLTTGQSVGNITADNMLDAQMFSWDDSFILFSMSSVRGVVQLFIHQPKDKNSAQKGDSKQPPILRARDALLKESPIYGTEMVTADYCDWGKKKT